jgi:PAS domain-containing protein
MTQSRALHLIEQFAAQAPFAVWITDSRGVAIFANRKLHQIFGFKDKPSAALGVNLFDEPGSMKLGLAKVCERAKNGEMVDTIIDVPDPKDMVGAGGATRTSALRLRTTCYPLLSATQKIEHYVFILNDVTETYERRETLRRKLKDMEIFRKSRESRLAKMKELEEEIVRVEAEIKKLGG